MDPSMMIAWLFSTNLCPPQPLPVILQSFQRRAELVHVIDGPFWQQIDLASLVSVLARRVGEVADRSAPFASPRFPKAKWRSPGRENKL